MIPLSRTHLATLTACPTLTVVNVRSSPSACLQGRFQWVRCAGYSSNPLHNFSPHLPTAQSNMSTWSMSVMSVGERVAMDRILHHLFVGIYREMRTVVRNGYRSPIQWLPWPRKKDATCDRRFERGPIFFRRRQAWQELQAAQARPRGERVGGLPGGAGCAGGCLGGTRGCGMWVGYFEAKLSHAWQNKGGAIWQPCMQPICSQWRRLFSTPGKRMYLNKVSVLCSWVLKGVQMHSTQTQVMVKLGCSVQQSEKSFPWVT